MERKEKHKIEHTSASQQYSIYLLMLAIGIVLLSIGFYYIRLKFFTEKRIEARLLKQDFYLNEALVYEDLTSGATKWLWEFGDGKTDTVKSGSHLYRRAGSYLVRLTVDNHQRRYYMVQVREPMIRQRDTSFRIVGPSEAYVYEQIRMQADGDAEVYDWYFGETGLVDAQGTTAFYTFHTPGTYIIKLHTDKHDMPFIKEITVTDPTFDMEEDDLAPSDEGDGVALVDIKRHLQSIAQGENFNAHYNYIYEKYLCKNALTMVNVANDKELKLEFRDYCLSLTFDTSVIIDEVEADFSNDQCVNILSVSQHREERRGI